VLNAPVQEVMIEDNFLVREKGRRDSPNHLMTLGRQTGDVAIPDTLAIVPVSRATRKQSTRKAEQDRLGESEFIEHQSSVEAR
jgi:hypothetical protein